MDCPYLGGIESMRICNASVTLMAPGGNDIVAYCTTEEHYRCPMLLSKLLRGGSISATA